jgi:hypothetical protein
MPLTSLLEQRTRGEEALIAARKSSAWTNVEDEEDNVRKWM